MGPATTFAFVKVDIAVGHQQFSTKGDGTQGHQDNPIIPLANVLNSYQKL